MSNPTNLHYTKEHEWVAIEGDVATIGITAYAAEKLGDVVFVDLPKVGSSTTYMKICGEIESTKSVGELYAPLDGEVTSGALSPTLGYPVAMGYVAKDFAQIGNEVEVDIRGTRLAMTVVKLPFYKRSK